MNDFVHSGGDSLDIYLTVVDRKGAVVDMTNAASADWWVKQNGAAVLKKTMADDIAVFDGPNGVLKITVSKTDTEDWSGDYTHGGRAVDALGRTGTIIEGPFHMTPNYFT